MKKKFFSSYLIHHHTPWFADSDQDGVIDSKDCDLYDPDKQGPLHDKLKAVKKKLHDIKEQADDHLYERNRELDRLRGFDLYLFVQNRENDRWLRFKTFKRMEYELHPAKVDAAIRNVMRNPRWSGYHVSDDIYWADKKNLRQKQVQQMTENLKGSFSVDEIQHESVPIDGYPRKNIFQMERDLVWGKQQRQNPFGFPSYKPVKKEQSFTGKMLKAPFQQGIRSFPYHPPFFDYRHNNNANFEEYHSTEVFDESE